MPHPKPEPPPPGQTGQTGQTEANATHHRRSQTWPLPYPCSSWGEGLGDISEAVGVVKGIEDLGQADYNLHYLDVDPPADVEDIFHERARQIMGLNPQTGKREH